MSGAYFNFLGIDVGLMQYVVVFMWMYVLCIRDGGMFCNALPSSVFLLCFKIRKTNNGKSVDIGGYRLCSIYVFCYLK